MSNNCQKHPESWIGLNGPGYCQECARERTANDRLALTTGSPSSFPEMPLAAALEFADSGESTGGIMTHEALKTLAAAIRGKRCEFCNEPPLTENERQFLSENAGVHAPGAIEPKLK